MSEPMDLKVTTAEAPKVGIPYVRELAATVKDFGVLGGVALIAAAILWPDYGLMDRMGHERKESEIRYVNLAEKQAIDAKAVAEKVTIETNKVAEKLTVENAKVAEKLVATQEKTTDKVTTALGEVTRASSELTSELKRQRNNESGGS